MAYVLGFITMFTATWFLIGWILRRLMKMSSKPPPPSTTGTKLDESGWGSAMIGRVRCNNCLKLVWFENGVMLRMMPLFGRGSLWLPGNQIEFGELEEKKTPVGAHQTTIDDNIGTRGAADATTCRVRQLGASRTLVLLSEVRLAFAAGVIR